MFVKQNLYIFPILGCPKIHWNLARAWVTGCLLLLAGLLGILAGTVSPVAAASGAFDFNKSGEPIALEADKGIEWRRDERLYIARGNAVAIRGKMRIAADTLRARYREKPEGGVEIIFLEAIGNAKVSSTTETLVGEKAVFDFDRQLLVMEGSNVSLTTGKESLTAKQRIEYWNEKDAVVARGNAVAERESRRVEGDEITAYFKDRDGRADLSQIEAKGRVKVKTRREFATADRLVYSLEAELAKLIGNVKITRGKDQINGDLAEMNMKTGVSKIEGEAGGTGRVRTLIGSTPNP